MYGGIILEGGGMIIHLVVAYVSCLMGCIIRCMYASSEQSQ